jgi:hypothetical protein
MPLSTKLTKGLSAFFTLLPFGGHAQTPGNVMTERVMGPNGEERELKSHAPPLPPPVSTLKPLSELMSTHAGAEVQSYESFVQPYTTNHIDVLTYHYENKRSGWNPNEVELTPKIAFPCLRL